MTTVLAIEVSPSTPTQWIATYYPTVQTLMGRRAEIVTALHHQPLPIADRLESSTRWLEADTGHPSAACYADHPRWAPHLAAGYAEALAVHQAEATAHSPTPMRDEALSEATVWVPPAQLSEWLLTDLNISHT